MGETAEDNDSSRNLGVLIFLAMWFYKSALPAVMRRLWGSLQELLFVLGHCS